MNRRNFRSTGRRKFTLLLLLVVAPPAATLLWLGVLLLEQDRSMLAQREREQRQAIAQAVTRALEQSVTSVEQLSADSPLPDGLVRLTISARGVEANPPARVQWLPIARALMAADTRSFHQIETLEFQGSADRALAAYGEVAHSRNAAVRAGALLRIARIHRRAGRWDAALRAYGTLAAIDDVAIEAVPADLIARKAGCAVLEEAGRAQELTREAATLETDLLAGRWTLDQASWLHTAREVARWTGRPVASSPDSEVFSMLADTLWSERQLRGDVAASLRRLVTAGDRSITVLQQTRGDEMIALAVSPSLLDTWSRQAARASAVADEHVTLMTTSGDILAGDEVVTFDTSRVLKLSAAETGLPWSVVVRAGASSRLMNEFVGRRRLLGAGLAAVLLLFGGGSYFLWTVVQREVAIARLQTDFVSAVSHEFRTPLTSLRHITELLEEDDDLTPARRRSFYGVLSRNTERLHHLVESLLDFARMESGRRPYNLQPLDAGELVTRVVADFQGSVAPRGVTIGLDLGDARGLQIRADAASLTNALWNLLDNAVKYSPAVPTLRVAVQRHHAGVAISVQDKGFGVAADEQREIFRRFVRGRRANELGINGTGLGLAMVTHIVEAHGGRIQLESREGVGSTFRIVLPVGGTKVPPSEISPGGRAFSPADSA